MVNVSRSNPYRVSTGYANVENIEKIILAGMRDSDNDITLGVFLAAFSNTCCAHDSWLFGLRLIGWSIFRINAAESNNEFRQLSRREEVTFAQSDWCDLLLKFPQQFSRHTIVH